MKSTCFFTLLLILFGLNSYSQQFKSSDAKDIALFPQQNDVRNTLNLSGVWNFKKDSLGVGEKEQWFNGMKDCRSIAVPGSWNEQFDDTRDYLNLAWYEKVTYIPAGWKGQQVFIRVGSANYAAKIWINGVPLGQHEGGHLPFAFEITPLVKWNGNNRITIQVENILKSSRVPPGGSMAGSSMSSFPNASFDFFPYAGLNRAVWLYTLPASSSIRDITVKTNIESSTGIVELRIEQAGKMVSGMVSLSGNGQNYKVPVNFSRGTGIVSIKVPDARLWSPQDPFLYSVSVLLGSENKVQDRYSIEIGVRTIACNNKQILLNGKPVYLRGFGKHEDFPVFGRGTAYPVMVKDYSLLKWIGANSYRTSHYPYDEEYMNMADREGILIIDETPAVGLFFNGDTSELQLRQSMCKQYINELITRDKNHPSVIMWSIANEPSGPFNRNATTGEQQQGLKRSITMLSELFSQAKVQDPTRLTTFAGIMGGPIEWLGLSDIISVNRYSGWYSHTGDIKAGAAFFSNELDTIYKKWHKPIMITEFGADTYPGMHADQPEMFTEEYQTAFIKAYLDVTATKDFVVGTHVWAFADFKTGQGIIRFGGMNYKGVFTRDRKPKMAAHYLRTRWLGK